MRKGCNLHEIAIEKEIVTKTAIKGASGKKDGRTKTPSGQKN